MSTIKLKSLPDLGGVFAQMKIRDDLMAVSPDRSILGLSIHQALVNNRPLSLVMATILHAYYDNPEGVIEVVGEDLMNRIKELLKNKKHG